MGAHLCLIRCTSASTEHPWLPLPFTSRLRNGRHAVESQRAYSAVSMYRPRPLDEVRIRMRPHQWKGTCFSMSARRSPNLGLELSMQSWGSRSCQTGVAVHILLATAIGVVKTTGSGRMPLHNLVVFNLLHAVVLECQGALDQIVRNERCNIHDIINARLVHAMWRRC